MEVKLTLFQNPANLQLTLTTSTFVIGNQYSNNEISLVLDRQDPFIQYSASLVIQPEDSKPFSPISITKSFTLSNLFTQTTSINVQIVLTANYDRKHSNVLQLKLIPSLLDNSPLDITSFYNRPVSVTRQTYIITEADLSFPVATSYIPTPDYVMPPSLLPQPDSDPGIVKPDTGDTDTDNDKGNSDNTGDNTGDNGGNGNTGGDSGDWDGGIPIFPVTLQTPIYRTGTSSLLVFHNGLLLSPDQYQETGNQQSNHIVLSSELLSPNDKMEFVSLG